VVLLVVGAIHEGYTKRSPIIPPRLFRVGLSRPKGSTNIDANFLTDSDYWNRPHHYLPARIMFLCEYVFWYITKSNFTMDGCSCVLSPALLPNLGCFRNQSGHRVNEISPYTMKLTKCPMVRMLPYSLSSSVTSAGGAIIVAFTGDFKLPIVGAWVNIIHLSEVYNDTTPYRSFLRWVMV